MGEVQSPNILNWYPFKENQKIKEIKNIEEIDLCNEKFDVIILDFVYVSLLFCSLLYPVKLANFFLYILSGVPFGITMCLLSMEIRVV